MDHNNKKKIFIEALEQRIMLDGAGASTFLDLIDERNQDKILDKKSKKITKFYENKVDDKSQILPFDQLSRDQKRNDRKQVVFIDSQVQDYQTLINSFNKDTEVCLIQSNEDGFKKIDSVLKDNQNISSLHIIGHGSAGKILFGNATLSNDTIQSYNQTLRSIGQSLTEDGDILFYGCNVASTDGGKTLISKISEVTKADIAASDDVTGQGGDWDLEKKIGIVETQNVKVVDYKHYLANGVASVSGDMEEGHDADNFNTQDVGSGGYQSSGTGYFVVTRERANVTNGTITLDKDDDGNSNVSLDTDTYAVDVYLVFMNDTENNKTDRVDHIGSITFDNEIYGIMWDDADTIAMSGFDKSGATYPTSYSQRGYENTAFHANNDVSSGGPSGDDDVDKETDWVSVSSNQRTLRTGVKNNTPGDYMRVFVASNNAPVAANNTGIVNEDGTLTVDDGASANSITTAAASHDSSPFDISGQEVNAYGLAFSADGTKMFVVGDGDDVNEYTLSTGFDVSTASFVDSFSVLSQEQYVVGLAFNTDGTKMFVLGGYGAVNEYTLSTGFDVSTASYVDSLDISSQEIIPRGLAFNNDGTKMFVVGQSGDDVNEYTLSTGFDVSTASFVDSFSVVSQDTDPGKLAFNNDGTKMFVMGYRGLDVNEYTLSTGFDVSTASFVGSFSVSSQDTSPYGLAFSADGTKMFVMGNTADEVNEYSLVSPYSLINVTGEHDGDVLGDDTDADGDSLTVASVRTGSSEGSGTAGTLGSALTGTYGQLTLNAIGSYTYVANQSAADDLDAGDIVTDSFNYTVSDGTSTDTATIVITVIGINDSVTAANNTGVVNEDGTLTVADGASANSITTAAASHDSSPFDVSGQEIYSSAVQFNNDGTKMFVTGSGGDDVNEYTLSTAFDVSTASFVDSFDYSSQETNARALAFNNDGTKMFVMGTGSDDVNEYTLSTAFDVSTASFVDGYSLNDGDPDGLAFSADGTKMFVTDLDAGGNDDDVSEYTLSTAFDVSTASFVDSYDVSSQDEGPSEVQFNIDGTKMFVLGYMNDNVYEYTLSTGFDVSTASYVGSFDVSSQETQPYGLAFNTDGTKMFVVGGHGDDVNEYSLVSPYSLINVTGEHDGDVLGDDTDADDSASLTVASVRIGASEGSGSAGTVGSALTGTYGQLTLNANGSYTYVANQSAADDLDAGDVVTDSFNYTVSDGTSTDTATIVITVIGVNDTLTAANNTGVVNEDGTLTVADGASANSITTAAASHDSSPFSVGSQEILPACLAFNNDGTKMFVAGNNGNDVNEYTLSTAWDVSTGSYSQNFSVNSQDGEPFGIAFNNDGTKMFIAGADGDDIHEYTLSTGFDVSTASYVDALDVSGQDSRPCGIRFNNDGTKLFMTGFYSDYINEYNLSTAYDISTGSYSQRFSVNSQDIYPRDVQFNLDGTRMFVMGGAGDDINEYTLSTGFDVSTASFVDSYDVSSQDGNPFSMTFNNDGTKMFMLGYDEDKVHEYALVSPYSLINVTGEHDGDVLGDDTDADDSASLTVASVRTGASEGSGTAGTLGSALTGTYGQLTLNANGSYTYVANQSAADDLDAGDVVTDSFNYTVSDGTSTDTATIVITVVGVNDTPAAVDDTDSVDANETTTATNGSSSDVLTDDTDADDSASLTVTAIQPSGGSSSSVSTGSSYNSSGTEVTGTYGTLTIGADGSYTYVADQDAADNISSGSSETDVFTYTVSDGTTTTTATLTITVSGTETETATEEDDEETKKETKKEKKEAKRERKEAKRERKVIKRAKRFISKNLDLPKTSITKNSEFNQGLKLVDLVAESKTTEVKEKNVYADKIKTKITKEGLKVNFKVFNDEGKEVQKYYGLMKDGSPLPKWIQIDPKTGKTKINIPKGTKLLEFKIISIDADNNKKQVTVEIDPKKIANDKEIIKQNKKLAKAKKIEVSNDGVVKLNSIDKDGSVNKTVTDILNDGSKSLKDIVKTIKPNEFLKLESNLRGNEHVVDLPVSLHFLLQYELKTSFENLKIVLKDGQELPNWIKFDPNSAKIISNPPKDVSSIDLKIIVEDPNGEITVKDLTINFSKENSSTTEKILDTNNEFVTLTAQLSKEHAKLDDYGSQVIDSL